MRRSEEWVDRSNSRDWEDAKNEQGFKTNADSMLTVCQLTA